MTFELTPGADPSTIATDGSARVLYEVFVYRGFDREELAVVVVPPFDDGSGVTADWSAFLYDLEHFEDTPLEVVRLDSATIAVAVPASRIDGDESPEFQARSTYFELPEEPVPDPYVDLDVPIFEDAIPDPTVAWIEVDSSC